MCLSYGALPINTEHPYTEYHDKTLGCRAQHSNLVLTKRDVTVALISRYPNSFGTVMDMRRY